MLRFFEGFLFLFEAIEMNTPLLCDKQMSYLRGSKYPINYIDLFVILFDRYQRFDRWKVDKQATFDSMKKQYIFLVVVREISNYICFAKIDQLEIIFMYDIDDIFVIDDSDISFEVEKILAVIAESLLYLLKLGILLRVDKFEKVLFLIHYYL